MLIKTILNRFKPQDAMFLFYHGDRGGLEAFTEGMKRVLTLIPPP